MNKRASLGLAYLSALGACSGAPPTTKSPAAIDCSTPPAAPSPSQESLAPPFTVTDSENAVAAGTTRAYRAGDSILRSANEGGTDDVAIVGHNACGLWLRVVGLGSESGGDAERRDDAIILVKEVGGIYPVERLGARLTVAVDNARGDLSFRVTTLDAIEVYIGE